MKTSWQLDFGGLRLIGQWRGARTPFRIKALTRFREERKWHFNRTFIEEPAFQFLNQSLAGLTVPSSLTLLPTRLCSAEVFTLRWHGCRPILTAASAARHSAHLVCWEHGWESYNAAAEERNQLTFIFDGLILNASKKHPAGGRLLQITCSSWPPSRT